MFTANEYINNYWNHISYIVSWSVWHLSANLATNSASECSRSCTEQWQNCRHTRCAAIRWE